MYNVCHIWSDIFLQLWLTHIHSKTSSLLPVCSILTQSGNHFVIKCEEQRKSTQVEFLLRVPDFKSPLVGDAVLSISLLSFHKNDSLNLTLFWLSKGILFFFFFPGRNLVRNGLSADKRCTKRPGSEFHSWVLQNIEEVTVYLKQHVGSAKK